MMSDILFSVNQLSTMISIIPMSKQFYCYCIDIEKYLTNDK